MPTVRSGGVAAIRDQLWAEARERFKTQGVIWQAAERLARVEHSEVRCNDQWEDAVRRWVTCRRGVRVTGKV